VLVDVEVPEADGYEVAAYVKQSPRLKNVPVLLLAGAFEPVNEERARAIGCDGVLVKPFEPQQLVSRVKSLIDRAQGTTSAPRSDARPAPELEPATVMAFAPHGSTRPSASSLHAVQGSAEPAFPLEPLEPPSRPVWEGAAAGAPPLKPLDSLHSAPTPATPATPKVSLVGAFSALLAAEASNQPQVATAPAVPASEASVEEAVRRVLVRMTDDLVRRIVLETAERLIREEIEKIKSSPE
jgi:hypothetical protein